MNVSRRQLWTEQRKYNAAPPPPPVSTHDVALHARTYGIRVAFGMMAADVRHIPNAPFTARPRCTSVQAAIIDAVGGTLPPPSAVPVLQHLPASLVGPGTRGSLLLVASVPAAVTRTLVANALGPMSTALPPWALDNSAAATNDDDDEGGNGNYNTDGHDDSDDNNDNNNNNNGNPTAGGAQLEARTDGTPSRRHGSAPRNQHGHWDKACPVCETGHDDAYHAFFECPSARLRVARRRLFASLKTPVRAIVAAGKRLAPGALHAHRHRIAGLEHGNWDSADGRASAFRLLCGFPFRADAAPEEDTPLSHALGAIFDALSTDTRHLVGLARTVVVWAAGCTRRAAAARRAAMYDCGVGVTLRPPPPPRAHDTTYPHGSSITARSHDPHTYTRWKLAHHSQCNSCGGQAGTLHGCAHCDLAIHAPGSVCSPGLSRLPIGASWLCSACSVAILPLTRALNDAPPVAVRART